jgi:hypothetical protein
MKNTANDFDNKKETPPSLSRFVISALFYPIFAVMAALISMAEQMEPQFLGIKTGLDLIKNFLFGVGTALTPPLSLLVWFVPLVWFGRSRSNSGTSAIFFTMLLSGLCFLNSLLSPINRQIIDAGEFDLVAMIQMLMMLIPLAVIYFGFTEIKRRVNR